MRTRQRAWTIALDAIVLLPLVGALLSPPSQYGSWANVSTGFGLLATSLMVVIVLLVSRIRGLTRWLGLEAGNELHRRLGAAIMVSTLAHVLTALAASTNGLNMLNPFVTKPKFTMGIIAALLMLIIAYLAVPRAGEPRYGQTARVHGLLAIGVLVFVALHVIMLGRVFTDPLVGVPMALIALLLIGVLGRRWILRPLRGDGAYVVRATRPESATATTVVLDPAEGATPPAIEPGQFVWLRRRRALGRALEHPFTVAASTRTGILELTVRARGEFSSELSTLPPGARVWLDGPHGSFVPPAPDGAPPHECGIVLIAGGVGITPIMSILRAHAAGDDPRPHRLLLAERPDEALFARELHVLARRLDLTVRRTEGRRLDVALLVEVIPPAAPDRLDYFVCGPPSLVGAALDGLGTLGVPSERIRTERFG